MANALLIAAKQPTLSFPQKRESIFPVIPHLTQNDGGIRMVLTFIPLPRLRLEPADGRRRGLSQPT